MERKRVIPGGPILVKIKLICYTFFDMRKMKKRKEETTIHLLLSGKHPSAKKFAGHHVLVINETVVPLPEGREGLQEIEMLEKKHGKTPTIIFVPRQDVSYILR